MIRFAWFLVCALSLALTAPAQARLFHRGDGFVRVKGAAFELDGAPYRYIGTNLWYGMNLGSEGPGGDQARLTRELDRLKAIGVKNLRVLALSEGPETAPWRIQPAVQGAPGFLAPDLLRGLDFLLREMGRRGMKAVVTLNNFWPWSGGMSQYVSWFGGGPIPFPPPEPGGSWSRYQKYTEQFYSNDAAMRAAEDAIRAVITRTNELTGRRYLDDNTIMAWQLANEPRGVENTAAFAHWIERTADFIKSLDARHLVTTGSEGETPHPGSAGMDFLANHKFKSIDYATAHIWAQNWDWFDPAHAAATYDAAVAGMRAYFKDHVQKAKVLGKPLVIEEFGLARDGGSYAPDSATTVRDRYYGEVFEQVYQAAEAGEPVAGANFWSWSGEGRPRTPGGAWKKGDAWLGDPPHENQGWYGIYDTDRSTLLIISKYAKQLSRIKNRR